MPFHPALLLRRLHLSRPLYYVLSPLVRMLGRAKRSFLPAPLRGAQLPSIEQAENLLSKLWPDQGASACMPNLLEEPCFDLQIIVPAYNAEAFIDECLQSIVSQTTRFSFLVIVVNDGSSDGTRARLEAYEQIPFVEIIDQANQGFSGARNAGLKRLRAHYVAFVDADDRLPQGAVEALLDVAFGEDADIVEGGFRRFSQECSTISCPEPYQGPAWEKLSGFPWGKVYRASLFHHVGFPPGYWFEDTATVLLFHPRARKVVLLPKPWYEYRQNPCGVTSRSLGSIRNIEALWVTRRLLEDAQRCHIPADDRLLDAYLRDAENSLRRMGSIPREGGNRQEALLRAAFSLSEGLANKHFPLFSTAKLPTPFGRILQQKNFLLYKLYKMLY